ncbi:MAG: carboxylesterase family protein [Candidatus Solibacter sp.]
MNTSIAVMSACGVILAGCLSGQALAADRVKTANGVLESTAPARNGVRSFKGIPFGQPPVGDLRWREPQPVKNWTGVRNADKFGPTCMQRLGPNGDYWMRGDGMSEDCLYLNVWTPAKAGNEKLPVFVYIFGGGFQNGDGSEPRYDGEAMARKGMVAVSINYRTNIFGFFAHPELTQESPHHASGNYGLLDQYAALKWVQENIAAFGGDPKRVTIGGESAGSMSVSLLLTSPLTKNMIAGAICESGSYVSNATLTPFADSEKSGAKLAEAVGAPNLAALRALSATQFQEAVQKSGIRIGLGVNVDGYFMTKQQSEVLEAAEQAKVPLMAGSNSEESGVRSVLGQAEPTPENFAAAIKRLYPNNADELLKVYNPKTADEVLNAAMALASARFISLGTWKFTEMHAKTSGKPAYRYFYTRVRPKFLGTPGQPPPQNAAASRGAVHSAEIQYAMGNLDLDMRYPWNEDDRKVSQTMQGYFVNFIKTGNPNGAGQPNWPPYEAKTNYQRMNINVVSKAEPDTDRPAYLVLDSIPPGPSGGRGGR